MCDVIRGTTFTWSIRSPHRGCSSNPAVSRRGIWISRQGHVGDGVVGGVGVRANKRKAGKAGRERLKKDRLVLRKITEQRLDKSQMY